MNLYKVVETGKGFTVWKVSEKSGGRAYESTGQRFDTREAAPQVRANAAEAFIRNSLKISEQVDVLEEIDKLKKAVFPDEQ